MFSPSPSNNSSYSDNDHIYNNNINDRSSISSNTSLKSVDEIPKQYRSVFSNFQYFNIIQSEVFDYLVYSDDSIVVSAPTGSGKTVIFELAIIRFLNRLATFKQQIPYKVIYVAPVKALCEERLVDWYAKFSSLGLSCISVTGDTDHFDFHRLVNHNFIITTPEKWDSLSRRWRDNKSFVPFIKLFMIDEIHILNDSQRGPTVEVIVSRMKAINNASSNGEHGFDSMNLRFVAASATIPNFEDIAEWFRMPMIDAKAFKFGDEMRPVKLKKVVLGYNYNSYHSTPFKFEITLNYKLQSIILQYAEGKPTLIFCSTRKSVEITASHLIQNLTINLQPPQKQVLVDACVNITHPKIKEMLPHGISFHHAGLLAGDRKIIEDLFRNRSLPILITTSTLAMGINLPAHLVIVKSTKHYSNGEYQDYSESMLLQMIGRAGRPQFDTSATAVILTTTSDKERYENMLEGSQPVESSLHKHLIEHVNAEVVLNTITDLGVAMEWLTSTFLYIRARKNPKHYGLPIGLKNDQTDKKLLEICQIEINRLARSGMLTINEDDVTITPTRIGSLMAKYYVAFDTMNLFTQVTGHEILQQVLGLISRCKEFSDMYLRVNDKKPLNILNKCRGRQTIRFPLSGKIKTLDMKVNCIIQAELGCLQIMEPSLINESQKIMRIGERISSCLAEYLSSRHGCFSALLGTLTLVKCFRARLWENSPYVSKQLSKIGNAFATAFVNAEKTTFKQLLTANPRDLERIINRKPPMGNIIQQQVEHLPQYTLELREEQNLEHISVHLKITLENAVILQSECTVHRDSVMTLLIGDSNNDIILLKTFKHNEFIQTPLFETSFNFHKQYVQEIEAHFISEDWVGIDCQTHLVPSTAADLESGQKKKPTQMIVPSTAADLESGKKKPTQVTKKSQNQTQKPSHVQTFVDTYFKKTKTSTKKPNTNEHAINQINKNKGNFQIDRAKDPFEKEPCQVTQQLTIDSDSNDEIKINSKFEDSIISSSTQAFLQAIVEESHNEFTQKVNHKFSLPSLTGTNSCGTTLKQYRLENQMNNSTNFDSVIESNENQHTLMKFRHPPPKKISNLVPRCSPPDYIKNKTENESLSQNSIKEYMENLPLETIDKSSDPKKGISWRSPLIISPIVKHSPIFKKEVIKNIRNNSQQSIAKMGFGIDINNSVKDAIPSSPTFSDCGSLFSQPNPTRPTLKIHSKHRGCPLSDRDYMLNSTQKEADVTSSHPCNGIEDIVSSSLLETLQNDISCITSTSAKRNRFASKTHTPKAYNNTAYRDHRSTKTQTTEGGTSKSDVETQTTNLLENSNHDIEFGFMAEAGDKYSTNSSLSNEQGEIEYQQNILSSNALEEFNNDLAAFNAVNSGACIRNVPNVSLFTTNDDSSAQYMHQPTTFARNNYFQPNLQESSFGGNDNFLNSYNHFPLNLCPTNPQIPSDIISRPNLQFHRKRNFSTFDQGHLNDLQSHCKLMHKRRLRDLQEPGPSGISMTIPRRRHYQQFPADYFPPTHSSSYPYTNPKCHHMLPHKYNTYNMYNDVNQYMMQQYLNPFNEHIQPAHFDEDINNCNNILKEDIESDEESCEP